MRASTRLLLLAVLCSACHRSEEPGSSKGAQSASSPLPPSTPSSEVAVPTASPPAALANSEPLASASGAPSASAKPPCIFPLGDVAPPQEKPAERCPKDSGAAPKLEQRALRFPEAPGSPKLTVEMARAPSEHERGLMFRTKMPENHGMLFEWPSEAQRVFWMRNTCIPLDMLFIAKDGTVAGIQEQVPTLNEAPRTVPCLAAYVLEVNAGWCRRHGVKPGMQMKLE